MADRGLLIDTSIVIAHLRAKERENSLLTKLYSTREVFLSSITLFELFAGAIDDEKVNDVKTLSQIFKILPFAEPEAEIAGKIFVELKSDNKLIDFPDILIAATSLANNCELATLNKKHFSRIKGLTLI